MAKDPRKTEEQAAETPEVASDMHRVLTTLDQVFSTFRTQLQGEAPKSFQGAAKVAVDKFNDIIAGLKFKSLPSALTIAATNLSSPTAISIELKWTDNTSDADGYKVKRCEGQGCLDLVEITRLPSSARSFKDDTNLSSNTTYRYQLVTFNARGETPSTIAEATTTVQP
jgi:hypothetical protein